jgi:hypothetical protein
MCKRSSDDPLVRHFIDEYRLNLLSVPREHAEPGDLYVRDRGGISAPGAIAAFVSPPPALPEPRRGEIVSGLSGRLSHQISVRVGLQLLQNFLIALGAVGIVDKLGAAYEHSRASSVRFRFDGATRDWIDPGLLGRAIGGAAFDRDNAFVEDGNRYYVVAAVVRAGALAVVAEDGREQRVELAADALQAVSAEGAVRVARTDAGEITYSGRELAIGVELYEIGERQGRLRMSSVDEGLKLRGRAQALTPALVGGLDGDALIAVR